VIGIGKQVLSLIGSKPRQDKYNKINPELRAFIGYGLSISMEPIVRSVGRSQLKRLSP